MKLTVVAFDPGETTGWCAMTVTEVKFLMCAQYRRLDTEIEFKTGQIDCRNENRGVDSMIDRMEEYEDSPIVHEDFIVDMNKIDQARWTLSPVRITAKFEYGLWVRGLINPFFIQNRSPVKTTCTDDRLKNWGLYDRNSGRHARDAVRHAYYFLRNCRGTSLKAQETRWKAWPHIFEDPQIRRAPKKPRPVGERVEGLG